MLECLFKRIGHGGIADNSATGYNVSKLLRSYAVSRFFYALIVSSNGGEQAVCGQIQRENALQAIKSIQRRYPKALEIHVRKVNEVPCV